MLARPSRVVAVAFASAGMALGACTDGDVDEDRLAEDLVEASGGDLDEEQAACVARGLTSSFGEDHYRAVLDAADGERAGDEEVRTEVIDVFARCDALGAVALDDP